MITLLEFQTKSNVAKAAVANALLKLSEHGKMSNFLM